MEAGLLLQNMRDPLGVPFYPLVFQGLGVVTFALHIVFVNLVVGGTLVAIWGHFSRHAWLNQLSRSLAKATTINISVAIVLGVAPLLFVQVIYDPLWYSSNLIGAWWTMIFLAVLIVGALSMYVFYLRGRQGERRSGLFGVVTILCLLVAAVVIHGLSMQALSPAQWRGWVFNGWAMNTGGWGLHSVELGRLLHLLLPGLLNTGVFLMLYAWYVGKRADADQDAAGRVALLGLNLARYATLAAILAGLWWLFSLPAGFRFMTDHSLLTGLFLSLLLIAVLVRAGRAPAEYAPLTAVVSLLTVVVMSVTRESLRMTYLKPFSYSVYDYPLSLDWGSTALFLVTFLIGIAVVGYLLRIAYLAGLGKTTA